jgi:hypothetical protein
MKIKMNKWKVTIATLLALFLLFPFPKQGKGIKGMEFLLGLA